MMETTRSNRHFAASTTTTGSTAGRNHHGQPAKKRRTNSSFCLLPRSQESTSGGVSPHRNHRSTTPSTSSTSSSSGYHCFGSGSFAETASLSSGSLGPAPAGLPDYIIAIPPIPDLRDADNDGGSSGMFLDAKDRGNRREQTSASALPTTRSLQAIRRYISTTPHPSG